MNPQLLYTSVTWGFTVPESTWKLHLSTAKYSYFATSDICKRKLQKLQLEKKEFMFLNAGFTSLMLILQIFYCVLKGVATSWVIYCICIYSFTVTLHS